jgi:hypothetical protein
LSALKACAAPRPRSNAGLLRAKSAGPAPALDLALRAQDRQSAMGEPLAGPPHGAGPAGSRPPSGVAGVRRVEGAHGRRGLLSSQKRRSRAVAPEHGLAPRDRRQGPL